jgi:hypothetical protein
MSDFAIKMEESLGWPRIEDLRLLAARSRLKQWIARNF